MTQPINQATNGQNWKTRTYVLGTLLGAGMGLLSAYLFTREAEQNSEDGEMPDIAPSTLLGLALSILGLIRQISETAKKGNNKDRNRRGR